MKLLCVQPGASYSTADVYEGVVKELAMLGHDVVRYNLDTRIAYASSWLNYRWEQACEEGRNLPAPSTPDVLYLASSESVLMALRHMPDWIVVFSSMYFHPDALIMLQRARVKVCIVFTESPYDDARQFSVLPYADVVFTNDKNSAEQFSEVHRQVHYLPHAFDPGKHNPDNDDDDDTPAHDVVFVGTGFRERLELLASIDWTGIDLGLYGSYDLLEDMPDVSAKLQPFIRSEVVDNRYAASLYRKAKIGLNIHRTSIGFGMDAPHVANAYSLNPRLFELAANQCFILSDHRPEMDDVFGTKIPTFKSAGEAETLIRRWLKDEPGRIAVSRELPEAVARHTFSARALQIVRTLQTEGKQAWHDTTGVRERSTLASPEAVLPALSSR